MPKDKTEVRRFLGLATYIRIYVRDFAIPMINLLKGKFERIVWTSDCHASFEALKKDLTKTLVLNIMDLLRGGLVLCTDANDMAIGAIMTQEGMVIAYESRKLCNAKLNYPVHENSCIIY